METTMTLSHLADLIIVISFCSMCSAGLGYILFQLIDLIIDGIKAIRKKTQGAQRETVGRICRNKN